MRFWPESESIMAKSLSNVLARSALAACSILILPIAGAEDYPMPAEVQLDPNPGAKDSPTGAVLTYETAYTKEGETVKIPAKKLRIKNNSSRTVFPIMRAQNTNLVIKDDSDADKSPVGLYDPFDTPHLEYRGYIGYQGNDGKFYYGLRPNETIVVPIPVVFWNAARMGIETAGEYLLNDETKLPNPLNNDSKADRSITRALPGSPDQDAKDVKGVVMWYRSKDKAIAPADDTEDQLVEWTIRDHDLFTNPIVAQKAKHQIPSNQLLNLINYDVSNVDSLYLPVAMEVLDAWVVPQIAGDKDGADWKPGSHNEPLGWTGSIQPEDFLQPFLRKFTKGDPKNPNELLGQYFGGYGWPYYNFPGASPDSDKVLLKIPSGSNLFPQSPLINVKSSYFSGNDWHDDRYMLSSGGTGPVKASIGNGVIIDQPGSQTIHLSPAAADKEKIAFIKVGHLVTGLPDVHKTGPNPILPGTLVTEVNPAEGTVSISTKLQNNTEKMDFDFGDPVHDYAAEALIRLWFSWADYYTRNWKQGHPNATDEPKTVKAAIQPLTATLVLTANDANDKPADRLGLVEGMSVTGPGLDDAQTEVGPHEGDAVILEIANDKKTLILSQVATNSAPPSGADYTFTPPGKGKKDLIWMPRKEGDPGYKLFTDDLVFDPSKVEDSRDPYEFSKQVYLIIASMNQIGQPNSNSVIKFMQDIIGANMGYILDPAAKASTDGQMLNGMIRDKIKSVLRGVTDFTKYPDKIVDGKHVVWYPNPAAIKASGYAGTQQFNVFNLDPYVWFIHSILNFTGYGFSVDDDASDIGASGGSEIMVVVTGSDGLPNKNQWTVQAPFGPVTASCVYSGTPAANHGITLYYDVQEASNESPIRIKTSVDLLRILKDGDKVVVDQVAGNPNANTVDKDGDSSRDQDPNRVYIAKNIGKNAFDLYHLDGTPTQGNGTCTPKTGRWGTYPFRAYLETGSDLIKVYERIMGDDAQGVFQGAFVTVNGVDKNPKTGEKFRVWQREDRNTGRVLLNTPLTDQDGNPLPANEALTVTFSGDVGTP